MSRRYEVRVRGRRAIATETRAEAEDWATVLGTSYAPATVHDLAPAPTPPPIPAQQPSIFDHLEDHTP